MAAWVDAAKGTLDCGAREADACMTRGEACRYGVSTVPPRSPIPDPQSRLPMHIGRDIKLDFKDALIRPKRPALEAR
jgi:hypothetical protein